MIQARSTLVLMAGPPGAGKSALARAIGNALGWPVIDKDTLKSTILEASVPEEIAGKLSYELLFALGGDLLLDQQLPVIVDSPAGYPLVVKWATETASRASADLKAIVCLADRDLRNQRLRERVTRPSQWLTDDQTDERIWREHLTFFPVDTLILDTVRPISELVAESLAYLRRQGTGS